MSTRSCFIGTIRTIPIEIARYRGVSAGITGRWRAVASEIQQVLNRFWREWERWHHERGHGELIRDWMDALRAWHRAEVKGRGAAPKCPVRPMPAELSRHLDNFLRRYAEGSNGRSVGLAVRKEWERFKTLRPRKEVSAYMLWQLILADLGGVPSYGKPMPIPFDVCNAKLPQQVGDCWEMSLRLSRIERASRFSHADTVVLRTGGRKLRHIPRILADLSTGTRQFCGSSLQLKDGKWYVLLTYRNPQQEAPDVDYGQVAILKAARRHPMTIRSGTERRWVMGRVRTLPYMRRKLAHQAVTRGESYRAGLRRGKGRRKAKQIRYRNVLANYKKTLNEQMVAWILKWMLGRGIGSLIYRAPKERHVGTRYLAAAGRSRFDGNWPWYSLEALLKRKCRECGLILAGSFAELKRLQAKAAEGVVANQVKSTGK